MDAGAYLRRHGWRGDGHGLSQSGSGIKKPLLISKKVDVLGVGLNKHAAVSDQWWMRAFDQGLKDLGTGKKGALSNVREKGMHFGGLYGRFVKGETVQGTIEERVPEPEQEQEQEQEQEMAGQKRKRVSESDKKVTKKRKGSFSDGGVGSKKKDSRFKHIRKNVYGRQVKAFIAEAVRRGLLAADPNQPISTHQSPLAQPEHAILQVFAIAGLTTLADTTKPGPTANLLREKHKRALKKAAKQYILENLSPDQCKQLGKAEESRRQQATQEQQVKIASTEEQAKETQQRKDRRKKKKVQAVVAENSIDSSNGMDAVECTSGADEIKLNGSTGKFKGIPDAVLVDRYPTKAMKKAQKLNLKTAKHKTKRDPTTTADNVGSAVDSMDDETTVARTSPNDASLITVIDKNGEVRWSGRKDEPVPLDPTIWGDVKPKALPKPVREARRKYRQENRDARKPTSKRTATLTSRGQRKVEQREKMALSILRRSRKAQQEGTSDQLVTVEGIENVPLVKIETHNGHFTADEMSRARRVARRVLKVGGSA